MKNTEATTDQKCYFCEATDEPMVYTKRHGWKCRSAKGCVARDIANHPEKWGKG